MAPIATQFSPSPLTKVIPPVEHLSHLRHIYKFHAAAVPADLSGIPSLRPNLDTFSVNSFEKQQELHNLPKIVPKSATVPETIYRSDIVDGIQTIQSAHESFTFHHGQQPQQGYGIPLPAPQPSGFKTYGVPHETVFVNRPEIVVAPAVPASFPITPIHQSFPSHPLTDVPLATIPTLSNVIAPPAFVSHPPSDTIVINHLQPSHDFHHTSPVASFPAAPTFSNVAFQPPSGIDHLQPDHVVQAPFPAIPSFTNGVAPPASDTIVIDHLQPDNAIQHSNPSFPAAPTFSNDIPPPVLAFQPPSDTIVIDHLQPAQDFHHTSLPVSVNPSFPDVATLFDDLSPPVFAFQPPSDSIFINHLQPVDTIHHSSPETPGVPSFSNGVAPSTFAPKSPSDTIVINHLQPDNAIQHSNPAFPPSNAIGLDRPIQSAQHNIQAHNNIASAPHITSASTLPIGPSPIDSIAHLEPVDSRPAIQPVLSLTPPLDAAQPFETIIGPESIRGHSANEPTFTFNPPPTIGATSPAQPVSANTFIPSPKQPAATEAPPLIHQVDSADTAVRFANPATQPSNGQSSTSIGGDARIPIGDIHLYDNQYTAPDGTIVSESAQIFSTADGWKDVVGKYGSYKYVSPEGIPIEVKWIADQRGFRILD